ncbi:DUF2442 domain-containing protein [Akkermansiaceae bacterium]|nr:DUF2442 domain-containing protein [Akkermansiaceae bacterium]
MEHQGELKLKIAFSDGLSGVLDFSNLLTGKIFSPLKESSHFSTALVQYGTIVWEGDVDMAPEYLHTKMVEQGVGLKRLTPLSQL